ncbi:MAG: GNAT family N-acetyltransferase [Nitriliruptoraceae bacterium]
MDGAVRHMLALSLIETQGAEPVRVASDGERWALAIVIPGRLLVPCGDPEIISQLVAPSRRWRLMVGDAAACHAMLAVSPPAGPNIVHEQRFMTVDARRVPTEADLPDPGLRQAEMRDVDRLADLAVTLHVDDRFGPHPGELGWRGYRQRLASNVRRGLIWCVGPPGAPECKVERSVSSRQWGVQLSGIVVDPAARYRRLGRSAVAAAVREARAESPAAPISLHVRSDNERAIAAYRAAGFVDREAWILAVKP